MKKALSIILCLAMIMSTVPMSVFAAPSAVTIGDMDTYVPEVSELPEKQENDSEEAELAAEGTVSPVKVLPANGETVDRRYPVAYYTFGKSVVLDAADVTLENIGNDKVGGVYFEEETNTIWVFPADPMATVFVTNTVKYDAWTSNIEAADGSLLYFPGVNFNLETELPADGKNLLPFGDMEYGWTPFDMAETGSEGCFSVVEDPTDPDNHVTLRTWNVGATKYPHAQANVAWKPGATYKVTAKVMVKDFVNDNGNGGNNATNVIYPDIVYTVPSFSCVGTNGRNKHDGQLGTTCLKCGQPVDREHPTSFKDHPLWDDAATVTVSGGVNNGWQTIEIEFTTRDNLDTSAPRALSFFSEPVNNLVTEFYIDDVEVYEEVTVSYAAGRNSALVASSDQRAQTGYNGDEITLARNAGTNASGNNAKYESTKEGYVIDGWTDGTNVYAPQATYVINGSVTLTPNVVPVGDSFTVTLSAGEGFESCYAGPGRLTIAVGETLDLSADEYKLSAKTGYYVLGWKNAETGEFVTSVTGNAGDNIRLEAAFAEKTGIVVDSEAKLSAFGLSAVTAEFDASVPGLKATPVDSDPFVVFDNLDIDTNKYSAIEVTYVAHDLLATSEAYFLVSGMTGFGIDGKTIGTKVAEEGGLVTYRYDFGANEAWLGNCSSVRIDPYNNNAAFVITKVEFVENEKVAEVSVTGLTAPVIAETPDFDAEVPAGVVYEVESVVWDLADEYFAGSTAYTATVRVKINENGYMFDDDAVVTLNGEAADVIVDSKVVTITKTFAATEAPKAIDIVLTSASAITVNDGTLELSANVVPVNAGDVIKPDTITWELTSGEEFATLNGNVLSAMWDGTVEVTATPAYDVAQKKTFEIQISNQVGFTIFFDKNTGAAVSGMPESTRAKKEYVLPKAAPVREGFIFDGWMLSPEGGETVSSVRVTKDVTVYAKWTKGGYLADFDKPGDTLEEGALALRLEDGNRFEANDFKHVDKVELDKENDELAVTMGGTVGNDYYMTLFGGSTTAIPLDGVTAIEYGFRTDAKGNFGFTLYVATKDADGNWVSPDHPTGGQIYIDNRMTTSLAVDGNVDTKHVLTIDVSDNDAWSGYLHSARLDIDNCQNYRGKTVYFDYVKLVGAESVETIELNIDAPEASAEVYGVNAVTTDSDKFVIKNITWGGADLVDGKYFAASTAYSAKVEIEAVDGYALSDVPSKVTVNGSAATLVTEGKKTYVYYTFPNTEELIDVELAVKVEGDAPAEITTSFGTLQLVSTLTYDAGLGVVPSDEVYWSIDESQKKYAWVDETGLVTGNTDCEELIVTAASKYDPSVKASIAIKVSGQIPEKVITFAAGTGETVTNLPEPTLAKDEYELPYDVTPVRSGYAFKGWSKTIGGPVITVDDVKKDTTYYAVWGYSKGEEFDGSMMFDVANASTTYEDGVAILNPNNANINEGILIQKEDVTFRAGLKKVRLAADDIEYVEIKTSLAPENLEICMYVQACDADGNKIGGFAEANNSRFYSHPNNIAGTPNQNIFNYVEQQGDWYIYKLPVSVNRFWTDYLYRIRFNFIKRDMNVSGYAWLPFEDDEVVKLDYIRFVGKDIPAMDITGLSTPVVKGEASTDATPVQSEAFKITSVEWEPALLGGIFFGSNETYKVTLTAEALKGYNAFSNPPARVTVNGNEAEYTRKNATTATITYTFPATEDVGDLELVDITLLEVNDEGLQTETKQIFSGDDFDLNKFIPAHEPTGFRWIGWSATEGGEAITGTINVTEPTSYYALYDIITEFDFSIKSHQNAKSVTAKNGNVKFDGAWAVVTPEYQNSKAELVLSGMTLPAADFDFVEVIYDGSLEDLQNDNKFSEELAPVLKVNGNNEVALASAEAIIASNKVAYKYRYDLTVNGKPDEINEVALAPYAGFPAWAVTSVKFVPNAEIEESAVVTGVDAPATWGTPDVDAVAEGNYVVDSILWSGSNGFNSNGTFKAETEYTAAITLKPATGYKIVNTTVTVDGEVLEGTIGANGYLTVNKTFAATERLVEFTLFVADAEITVADGTVKLTPVFTATNPGETVPVTTVKWEIISNGPDGRSATIDANGVVKASFNAPENVPVTVKATSDYNPEISVTANVVITNQIESYTVTFDANTKSTVTGMPSDAHVKFDYTLPKQAPVREGFSFAGWVKSPTDTVSITKDYITKDTTYYALWVKGIHFEFFEGETVGTHSAKVDESYDYENGTYSFVLTGTDPQIYINSSSMNPGTPWNGPGLFKGDDYRVLEIRMKTEKSVLFNHGMYFESVDAAGNVLGPSYAVDSTRYVANFNRKQFATGPDDYTVLRFDMSEKSDWVDGYPTTLRIDVPDDGTAASLGFKYTIDYIRVVNYETGEFEITGIDAPVAKAVADKDAVAKDTSKYVVTNVAWEGGLLHDYYFGSNTAYTVAVTIKGAPGYFVSDAPSKATINGFDVDSTSYNAATGELTLKYTFPATGVIDNETAHDLVFVAKNDNGLDVSETRTIFEGDVFEIGSYQPISIPSGKRWIGWSEEADATANTVEESFVVDSARTFYAVYEDLTQFDYSNYYHTFGTTAKGGSLTFENGLAVVSPDTAKSEPSLTTPATNISGKDFAFVEVYYSSFLTSRHDGYEYDNLFGGTLRPALKFSTMDAPTSYSYSGTLVGSERVKIGNKSFQKYTYDMTTAPEWFGKVGGFYLQPYGGYPNWGVGFIKLVPNVTISDVADINLTEPEVWATPDIADNISINDKYEVVDVKWTPSADTFKANTAYSVTVTYKPVAGYAVENAVATINGIEAEVKSAGNNAYTATIDFAETAGLKDVEVVITGKTAITGRGRYLDLKGTTYATDGSQIPVTDVTWSIKSKGTNAEIATISENGRVYPVSNGTVIVTAKSVYDPSVSATHEIKISNQANLVTVTFDKNTFAEVTGMPSSVKVYGSFVPENYDIKREGFFFTGWSTDEDALEPDTSFNITEDTVLYAKWGAGYEWSFNDASTSLKVNWDKNVKYENGIGTFWPQDPSSSSQVVATMDGMATSHALETAKHQDIEIRFSSPVSTYVKFYLQSATADGGTKSVWSETARDGSLSPTKLPANAPGQFQTLKMNLKAHKTWNVYPYVQQVRLDLPEAAPTETVQIDYVRLLTSERSVKFEGNGGLIPLYGGHVTTFKETYSVGNISLPADPVREGYEFLGWAKDPENYNKLYNNKFPVTDDHILYAIWTPAAVLDEETVAADGAEVTANEDGTVTVVSETETTPVIAVADSMEVGDNQTIVVKLNANYASTTEGGVVLSFTTEDGTPKRVVLENGAVNGKVTISKDLSEDGFEGTVTNVALTLPSGVINSLTVESVAFTTEEYATLLTGTGAKKDVVVNPDVIINIVGSNKDLPTHGKQPAGNGGAVTEFGASTSTTPKNKKVKVPARPADDAPIVEKEEAGTTTPATDNSKFKLSKTYDGRFVDVTKSNWFYADVEKSYRLGLMNGKSDTTFVPDGTVTLAEAITVAARMNAIYNGTTVPAAKSGEAWYQTYVTYATSKGIITSGQYSDYNALATREQVAVIFVRALPSGWYNAQNLFNTIPDVPSNSASFSAIQRLYNAGVVTGVDDKFNFKPAENIKRSELSAIINRVALKESRIRVVTEDEKNSKSVKVDAKWLIENATVGNCVEKNFTDKDGLAWAMPSKNDPIVNDLQNIVGGTINADEYKTITVVVKPENPSAVPTGHQAKIYYSSPTVELSEANNVRVGWPKVGADGTVTLTFKMTTNPSWKGEITFARFDPFDLVEGFSVESITFAP